MEGPRQAQELLRDGQEVCRGGGPLIKSHRPHLDLVEVLSDLYLRSPRSQKVVDVPDVRVVLVLGFGILRYSDWVPFMEQHLTDVFLNLSRAALARPLATPALVTG